MWAQRTYSTLSMYLTERIVESKWEKIIHKSFVCLRSGKLLQFSPGIKCKTFVEYRRLHLQLIPLGGSSVPQTNLCTRNKAIPSAFKEQKPIIYIKWQSVDLYVYATKYISAATFWFVFYLSIHSTLELLWL